MVWIVVAAVLLAAVITVLFVPLRVCLLVLVRAASREKLLFAVDALGGVIKREWRVSIANLPGGGHGLWIKDRRGRRFLMTHIRKGKKGRRRDQRKFLKHLYRCADIQVLEVDAELGLFSDAAATALAAGLVQAVVFAAVAIFYPPKGIEEKRIVVLPRFNRACFNFRGKCIITLRLEHIISAGWNNLLRKRKKAV